MISFTRVWDDVQNIIDNEDLDINIIEKYNGGFAINHNNDTAFINKQDFVSVWCKIQCDDEVCVYATKSTFTNCSRDELKELYVCKILKQLPYIEESLGILKLV
ncbi:MAG: hypothetical protein RSB70_00225 [Clostridium sp.]